MTEEFELVDNTEQQSRVDVRELICCGTIKAAGYTMGQHGRAFPWRC
jgi:hypothetical protein